MKNLSVIIPCYNESNAIPYLVNKCRNSCINRNDIEFIFVDNGSNDSTNKVFKNILNLAENDFAKLVTIKENKGYGYGILKGLNNASGKIFSWTHADLQTDPKDVILAYEKYKDQLFKNKCIVKGNRIGRNFFDYLFTLGMSVLSSLILNKKLFDINAQPKIFNKLFYKNLKNPPKDFSLDLYLIYTALVLELKVETFPVFFRKRHSGNAKGGGSVFGKLKLIIKTFNYILELKKRINLKK